jgi:hypothetical protein
MARPPVDAPWLEGEGEDVCNSRVVLAGPSLLASERNLNAASPWDMILVHLAIELDPLHYPNRGVDAKAQQHEYLYENQ